MALTAKQQAQFDIVCERIAEGMSLKAICEANDVPSRETIRKWLASDETGEIVGKYACAREDQADIYAEEILEIADDARNDWMEQHGSDDAGWKHNGEHVQRSRLRIDSRKWVASKLKPKKYGDKQEHNHTGQVNIVYSELDAKL